MTCTELWSLEIQLKGKLAGEWTGAEGWPPAGGTGLLFGVTNM